MKTLGESKLLLIMGLVVLLGGGALFGLNALQNAPDKPTPHPTPTGGWGQASFDKITKDARNVLDKPGATVTVVEFADFQCPSCRRAFNGDGTGPDGSGLAHRLEKSPQVRYIFRHFPFTDMHERALPAAVAAEAAGKQGKFWPMYDALFTGQKTELTTDFFDQCARKVGLDLDRFHKDLQDKSLSDLVEADRKLGVESGIDSTPTFIVRSADGKITQATGATELSLLMKKLKL